MQASFPCLISGETEADPELPTCLLSPLPLSRSFTLLSPSPCRQSRCSGTPGRAQRGSACRQAMVPLRSSRQRGIQLSKQALPSCFALARELDETGQRPSPGTGTRRAGAGGLPDGFGMVRTPQSAGTMCRECRARADAVLVGCARSAASIPHRRPSHGHNTDTDNGWKCGDSP